ncbi:MAG: cation diffusion facilitator family transporter [Candidatus Methanomethyliaceae archaeon]|nr:cation diffusion facilitator family transporter [Candidatus Methanomethyliaceae archaeon]MDW7970528.1 cation diffusion facilitator family transporter [Nitrososphaerota archaeon]
MSVVERNTVERLSIISLITMTTIGLFEISIGFLSGSIGLIGDAVDSFSDATISLLIWIGLRISKRGPDGKFHFGYLRAETLFSMMGAIIIVIMGLEIIRESYSRLFIERELIHGDIAVITALIAMMISTMMLVYKIKIGRSFKLLSMKTEILNSITDSSSSIFAFIGLALAEWLGMIKFDSIAGMIIGVIVMFSSYNIIKEGSLILMDACTCPDVTMNLENMVKNIHGVKGVKGLRLRRMGSKIAGDITIIVDSKISVKEANKISKEVEKIAEDLFNIEDILVKIEPSD